MRKIALLVAVASLGLADSSSAGAVRQGATARIPLAHDAAHFTRCPQDPGGAFYNVRTKLVSCGRAEAILHHNGRGFGFRCHVVGHGIGGGFPATEYCGRNPAAVSGDVVDGPTMS